MPKSVHRSIGPKIMLRVIFLCCIFPSSAYAYIDPGMGLLVLQGLFAGVGAALVFIKKPRQLIAKLFGRNKKIEKK